MHLNVRQKRPGHPLPGDAETPQTIHKPLTNKALTYLEPSLPRSPGVAADVHLCPTDNYGESMAFQKKILIVDDSPAEVKLMQGLLEREGYWPVGLNDPRRVEETIAAERPSVILLDVVMPDRNGCQICRDLKGNAEFNTIPVILVTSKDTASDKYWGQQQGADGYVTKPFTREELLRAVRRFA